MLLILQDNHRHPLIAAFRGLLVGEAVELFQQWEAADAAKLVELWRSDPKLPRLVAPQDLRG